MLGAPSLPGAIVHVLAASPAKQLVEMAGEPERVLHETRWTMVVTSYGGGGWKIGVCQQSMHAAHTCHRPPVTWERWTWHCGLVVRGRRQRRVCAAQLVLSGTQPPRRRIQKQVGRNRLLQLSADEPEQEDIGPWGVPAAVSTCVGAGMGR